MNNKILENCVKSIMSRKMKARIDIGKHLSDAKAELDNDVLFSKWHNSRFGIDDATAARYMNEYESLKEVI